MSDLLNDEGIKTAIRDYGYGLNCGYGDDYFKNNMGEFQCIAKAQAREVVEWGNELCPHSDGGIPGGITLKRQCHICWQAFQKEVEDG